MFSKLSAAVRRNYPFCAISPFVTIVFQKSSAAEASIFSVQLTFADYLQLWLKPDIVSFWSNTLI